MGGKLELCGRVLHDPQMGASTLQKLALLRILEL